MKYAITFLMCAGTCAFYAVTQHGWMWLLLWPALALSLVAIAYLFNKPALFGKRDDGTMHPALLLALLPYLIFAWLIWHLVRKLTKEPATNEVTPTLIVGRRLLPGELPANVTHMIDLTAEFAEPAGVRGATTYRALPMLDGMAVSVHRLNEIASAIAAIEGVVYIHCAQGHGRTGLVAAAVLLVSGEAASDEQAIQRLKLVRPGIELKASQRRALAQFEAARSATRA
ncbi:MAG: tyrosine-protein phosphatase [Phycisphaeraceae bacterium]